MNKRPKEAATAEASAERWRRADLARDAQAAGPHELTKLAVEFGMPVTTLRRYARVARAFPEVARGRLKELTFSHLEAVIGANDAVPLLKRARMEGWSVTRVKAAARVFSDGTQERTAPKDAIDLAIRYIESQQALRPGREPRELERHGLELELARLLLMMIKVEANRRGKVDVA
jgi:hypothetical protein